jgi:hypothetical protein
MERHRASEGQTMAFAPVGALGDSTLELVKQARFADPGVADDEHHLALAAPGAGERLEQLPELALAPYQRGQAPVGLDFQTCPALVCGNGLPRDDGLGLALEAKLAERSGLEVAADEPVGGVGDRNLPGLAHLLQARRNVGRVADGGVVHAQVASDAAHHDESGVEPLPRAEADAARRQLSLILDKGPRDAERGVHGPARVILVGDGRSEQRHDPVAEKLVDRALVAVNFGEHEIEGPAHQPVDLLGVEALRQRRKPRDIHEQYGHLLAFAGERAFRGKDLLGKVLGRVSLRRGEPRLRGSGDCGQRSPATPAKLLAALVEKTTRYTRGGEREPAVAAEAATFTVLRMTSRTLHALASDRSG